MSSSSSSPAPSFRSALIAGGIAGTTVDLTLFPLDTLKTRLQSASGFFAAGGFHGIYRGVGSALVGSAPGAAFFFCTYEAVKKRLLPEPDNASLPGSTHVGINGNDCNTSTPSALAQALAHMAAASLGEVAACAVRVPTEVVKQRAQAGLHGGSSAAALAAILAQNPSRGPLAVWRELYRGWTITVFREVPFTVIQFPLWEALKAWRRRTRSTPSSPSDVSALESALFGSLAGAVAAALTTPLDVVKTRVMLSKDKVSIATVFRRMLRQQGIRPFFAGITPRVTWISLGGAIFLGSYQWATNLMASFS
ncbi:hypothetical protein CDD82_3963 [Ophiocordyceps australis]|uniref:Mitochondrial carrier protein PET8 n=1 Tax=Ophiocordyceps australis TaxID=1399860 RepID=A0A2C5Z8Y7_9HYPO|nr:hypothetical protein CDD82_3963 [Ophiocordyceps australis]